jgi:chemotaxis protein methyltransferase WspC
MTDRQASAEALLAERIGLDPQAIGAGAIARALHARMSALGLHDRDEYLRRLSRSDDEQQELIEEVVIPESWFFRDERPFVALRAHLAARRDGDRETPPIRLLSVPCACGEEPYSIAITLLDLGFTPGRFQIDAVDISARHLAMAERGVYRAHSFRGKDLAFRDRYFHAGPHPHAQAHGLALDPSVRATVRFTRGNLLDPDLLSDRPRYDIIFCRNVLIYLDAASRRRAFATLDRLLGLAGILFVGHAERLAIADPRFEPWGENASFALCR